MSDFIDKEKKDNSKKLTQRTIYQGAAYVDTGLPMEGGTAVCHLLRKVKGPVDRPARLIRKQLKEEYRENKHVCDILRHEYEVGRELHSEYIARYYSYDDEDKCIYIEYIDGNTVKEYLDTDAGKRFFTGYDAYHHIHDFCQQVLAGMQQIHAHRLCHCDLTDNNIMIRRGTDCRAVIIDLGMALTQGTTCLIGTTDSQKAPEMEMGKECHIDILCDIYMFGLIMQRISAKCPVYEPICKLCTIEDPAKRYQSVDEVSQAIEDVYSKEVNDQFNRLLSRPESKDTFVVRDAILYCGNRLVCPIKYLTFVKNSDDYIHLITERQNAQTKLEESTSTDKSTYNQLTQQLYKLNLDVFVYENDMITLASSIHDVRNIIEATTYQKIEKLFNEGRITEAKTLIDENTLNDELDAQQSINIKNTSHTEDLVRKMMLYVSICKNDYTNLDSWRTIEPLIKKCIDTLSTINYDKRWMAKILTSYGNCLSRNHKNDEAISQYQEAQIIYQELQIRMPLKFRFDIAECHRLIAIACLWKENYEQAIIEFTQSKDLYLVLYNETYDQEALSNVCKQMEEIYNTYLDMDDYDKAQQFIEQTIKDTIDNPAYTVILAKAYRFLCSCYQHKHEYDKAISVIRKKCMPFDEKTSFYLLSGDYRLLGKLFLQTKEYDEAEANYKIAIDIKKRNSFDDSRYVYKQLAKIKIIRGDLIEAEQMYRDICKQIDINKTTDRVHHIQELRTLADLNLKCNHQNEAIENLQKALKIITGIKKTDAEELLIKHKKYGIIAMLNKLNAHKSPLS